MSKLRDYFFSDLNNVFFNTDEFSEEANVDGKLMEIIPDNELLKRYKSKEGEGLAKGELLFHAKKIDFEKEPFVNKMMRVNQKVYRIADLQEDDGMYTIMLVGHRS